MGKKINLSLVLKSTLHHKEVKYCNRWFWTTEKNITTISLTLIITMRINKFTK